MHRLIGVVLSCSSIAAGSAQVGCTQNRDGGDGVAASAAAGSSAATSADVAGATASPTASAAAKAAPAERWAPDVWEAAFSAARGEEPKRPIVEEAVPPLFPACATFEGREHLRAKYQDAYAKQTVETEKTNAAKRQEADKTWLPLQQAWLKAARRLDGAMAAGVFPAVIQGAATLDRPGPAGSSSKLVPVSFAHGEEVDRFRQALARDDTWSKPFQCRLLGVVRTPRLLDPKTREALKASGAPSSTGQVDQLACQELDDSPNIALLIEIPAQSARAKVSVAGTDVTIAGYEVNTSPWLDPEIGKAIAAGDTSSLKDRIIEVTGVSKLHRAEHGAPGYALLTNRGLETKLAIRTAEYKTVWLASFERACADVGLGCTAGDGRPEPSVTLKGKWERTAAPAPTSEKPVYGAWETAAREVDPRLSNTDSPQDEPWSDGVFPTVVEHAARLGAFPDPGKPATLAEVPAESAPLLVAFRTAIAAQGGIKKFACEVLDMGQEIKPPVSPLIDAALKAKGQTSSEASNWNVVCRGDKNSHIGTVVLWVPSHSAWAMIEGGNVKDYHLEHHGHWAKELRDKLIDVGIGTKLEIHGAPRMWRNTLKHIVFRKTWPTPLWHVSLAEWQCPHDGAGCTPRDGADMPVIRVAEGGLKPCPVSSWVYPPQ